MPIAKAVISGTVFKAPEKRFTQNNLTIADFVMDINEPEEWLLRAVAYGNLAETIAADVALKDKVVVEGRLQFETVKAANGQERKVPLIQIASYDKLMGSSSASASTSSNLVQFGEVEPANDLIGEDEIPF